MLAVVNLLLYAVILPLLARKLQTWFSISSTKADWILATGSCVPLAVGTAIIGLSLTIPWVIVGEYAEHTISIESNHKLMSRQL